MAAFENAEDAWFWAMAALSARRSGQPMPEGPCEPDEVVKALDQLYRRRRIELVHSRILRIWGERQRAPNQAYALERSDAQLWRQAIDRLSWSLIVRGIVVPSP